MVALTTDGGALSDISLIGHLLPRGSTCHTIFFVALPLMLYHFFAIPPPHNKNRLNAIFNSLFAVVLLWYIKF